MKKKFIFSLTLILFFFLSAVFLPVYAESQEELQKKKAEASQNKEEYEYQINMKKNTAEEIANEINKADEKINTIEDKVKVFDGQISEINTNLKVKNQQLALTQAKQIEEKKNIEKRLRSMYMFSNKDYANILFSSINFADFIARADMIFMIAQADQNAVNALERTTKEVKTKQEEIKADKEHLESLKKEEEIALASQNNIREQEKILLAENQHVIDELQAKADAAQAVYEAADNSLAALAAAREVQVQQQLEEESELEEEPKSGPSIDLIWPIASQYRPINWDDMYGNRIHPITGILTWHNGYDIVAPGETSVFAPGNGIVTYANWNGGYGKCVMIAMDGGTVLFGHLSNIAVSEGQFVRQGECVGGVGTTGFSSGNHLHLSFLVNGDYVDPLNYMHWS